RVDSSRTRILDERGDGFLDQLGAVIAELDETAERSLALQGRSRAAARLDYSADLRYVGQNYEINIRSIAAPSGAGGWAAMRDAFHAAHRRQYGFSNPDRPFQLVTERLTAFVPIERPADVGHAGAADARAPSV